MTSDALRTARAYGTLVAVIAMINAANRCSVITRMPGGAYEPGMFGALSDRGPPPARPGHRRTVGPR
ncbi:hypothetical protein GTY23_07990, partial [Streptomyces sp. SID5998]|nr:hypothetical protein [Streptomyces sp. SID5998]